MMIMIMTIVLIIKKRCYIHTLHQQPQFHIYYQYLQRAFHPTTEGIGTSFAGLPPDRHDCESRGKYRPHR